MWRFEGSVNRENVPNLISYLHEFFQNFSQSLAICFELFSFGEFVYSEIIDSGPHLSAAARRAGPARQRAVAAWLPRATHLACALRRYRDSTPRVPTAHLAPADRVPRSPCRRQRSTRRARPSPDCLARAARLPTASRRARPSPRPTSSPRRTRPSPDRLARATRLTTASRHARPSPRPRRPSPDRLTDRATVPTASPTLPPSAVPTPVSRYSSAASHAPAPCHRRLAKPRTAGQCRRRALAPCAARCAGRPSWAASAPRTQAAHAALAEDVGCASAAHAGRARTVQLGRARFWPVAPG
jgi:hypothetical protein